jgi:glycosyltransferase involved in cell wall biosynthesis
MQALTYLGDARLEKGIVELFEAIRSLKTSDERKFVLQVSDPDSATSLKAIAKLRAIKRSDIELLESALSEEDYRTLLESADIVLMPYRAKDYQNRSSGILAEAIAAGKPVIVTDETWLSNCVKSFDTGLVCACKADAIAITIVEACEKFSLLQDKAKQASSAWIAKHNAGECLDRILLRQAPTI